ncbi:MAG TPA: sialidase family protein [Tepidisphaeraceae bacterium]|nr:sialidase family protein [Tepidisphaeraceae bacterium]
MQRLTTVLASLVLIVLSVMHNLWAESTAQPEEIELDVRLQKLPDGTPAGPFLALKNGTLLCISHDKALLSRDEGATWEQHPLFTEGAFRVRPEYAMAQSRSGAIVLLFIDDLQKQWKWDNEKNASAVDAFLYVWSTRSLDGGVTWSPPAKVQDGYCGAIRDLIQTRDGTLVSPLQKFLPEQNRHATTPVYSTDDGLTWNSGGTLDIGGRGHHDGSIEATLVERRDGSLLMLLRTCDDYLYQSVSSDSGRTWGAMSPTTIDSSSSPAMIKRLASGQLMMAWNRLYPEGAATYPRRGGQHSVKEASWHREELSIAFSNDDAVTWSKPEVVARQAGKRVSYPFILEVKPGKVWLTTMQGGLRAELNESGFTGAVKSPEAISAPVRVGTPGANEAVAVRLPDDELRVYYVWRPEGTEIRSIGSKDHGRTWSEERTEFKLPGTAYYGVQVVVDQHGELQCMFHILGKGENGYNGRHYDIWHTRTSDGRSRWEDPKKIYDGYAGSLRGFIKTRTGRLILSVSVAVPERAKPVAGRPDYGWNDAVVFYSDDAGTTWTQGNDRLLVLQDDARGKTRYGAVEPHLIEHQDGRITMLIRTKNGFFWQSVSSDDGTTWPQPTVTSLISSDSPAASARLRDGRLVLLLNACQRWDDLRGYAIGGRHVLHAAISDDDGKTWRGFREILRDDQSAERGDRGTSYAAAVETGDGNVLVVSGQGEGKKHILLLSPDWIAEQSQTDDFRDGLAQWTTYEGAGAELTTLPDQAGKPVLAIRQTDPLKQAGAVWNFPAAVSGEVTMRFRLRGGDGAATLALTDHYCVVADTLAEANSIFSIDLRSLVGNAEWHDLTVSWKAGGECVIALNGLEVARPTPQRAAAHGVNYLRVKAAGAPTLEVARVSARASQARAEESQSSHQAGSAATGVAQVQVKQ